MKLNLKKTTIALAIATVSGAVLAAPVTTTWTQTANDAVLGNNYQQTIGSITVDNVAGTLVSQEDINTGALVSSTAQAVDGPEVQIDGINYRNYTYQEIRKGALEARNEKFTNATVDGVQTIIDNRDNSTATGEVTRTANTRVQLDKTINPATEIAGTKERLNDTTFSFSADNVNTVIGAHTTSNKGSVEWVDASANANDERNGSLKYQVESSDLTTQAKLGADGKQVGDQTIRVGTVKSEQNFNNVDYKRTIDIDGLTTSKNANGILSSIEYGSSNHEVGTNYQTNDASEVVAFNLSADKENVLESTVNTNKSASSVKNVDYDEVNAAGLDFINQQKNSQDNAQESLLDGFVSVDKNSYESTVTQYNQAALGTSNAIDYIQTSKSSSESKERDFVKNADGEIVLTNAKPSVNTETEEKYTRETYESVYQPTRYAADDVERNITKGDAYNQHILNDGIPTQSNWWGHSNTDVQKSTDKGTESKVVTHKQDGDFQEHWNTSWDESATYARNHQENIEVDRDISNTYTEDNKYLDKITGISVVKEAEASDFEIGTVAVDVHGNKFTAADLHTWKDETGKDRYYVIIDQDGEGNQVRSEVTFKNGTSFETQAAEIQTVKTEIYSDSRTDKVTMGAEVAYQTNQKETWDEKETSKDGSTVYTVDKGSDETNVKVFSVGKNALHHEAVTTNSRETVDTEFDRLNDQIIFKDGQPVVLAVESNKYASNEIDRLFQEGQDKTRENISTSSFEGNIKNAAGVVQTSWVGHDNETNVDYAAGQALANTFVRDQGVEVTAKTFKTDEDGDVLLVDGKPVEQGTISDKETVKTTENLYQIGQERKADQVVVTDSSEKSTNIDGSGRDLTVKSNEENIEYRAGQKDGKKAESNLTESSELSVKNADSTGYTYKVDNKESNLTNDTADYLLANRDVKSVQKTEWTESLAASGKDAVSITRGTENVNRTDSSNTSTKYGSETVTAATGAKTTVAKNEVNVTDKFGTFESNTLTRTETKVAVDKSSVSNTATRFDSVEGLAFTATQTTTDVAGKASTSSRTTSLNASGLTTDRITLNGRDLQTELNNMGNNIDDVQRKAYRGIAIALAAQQAVPNVKPGQVAVFGGVGHYEGETAGSVGVVTSFTDRISASGAFGFAGGNEFGGRVGVAYVFGGE